MVKAEPFSCDGFLTFFLRLKLGLDEQQGRDGSVLMLSTCGGISWKSQDV